MSEAGSSAWKCRWNGLNNEAFLFVSTNLNPTNEIPEKILAYSTEGTDASF